MRTDTLNGWEVHALVTFCLDSMTREQHLALARNLPEVYNKLWGREIIATTNIGLFPVSLKSDK